MASCNYISNKIASAMKIPIEVHNKFIPFKGFGWLTFHIFSFTRKHKNFHMSARTRRHEFVHTLHSLELSVLFAAILIPLGIHYSFTWWAWALSVVGILFAFWICYGLSWLIEVLMPPYPGAYYYTCFETEAYNHEDDPDYWKHRIPYWGFLSCIPNRKVRHHK